MPRISELTAAASALAPDMIPVARGGANRRITPQMILDLLNHNNINNIQGGTAEEYYHLTSNERAAVQNMQIPLIIPASGWVSVSTNFAEYDKDTSFTNGELQRLLYDSATSEYAEQVIITPQRLNASGTVTFIIFGYAETIAANKGVEFNFEHDFITDGEDIDEAFASVASGTISCAGTQDFPDVHTWTETVSNLGWTGGRPVRIRLKRDPAAIGDDLASDYGVCAAGLYFPVA